MLRHAIWAAAVATAGPIIADQIKPLTEQEAIQLATESYIYGYPLVTMDLEKQIMTNVVIPTESKSPMGQFAHMRGFPDASYTAMIAPNADTLYSTAWLDLAQGPYVLHVPDEKGRYYLMALLSGWTDVIASLGTRTTGTQAQDFVITGPNWKGELPKDVRHIKSTTDMLWIIGRTYCSGTPVDLAAVHDIQDNYTLVPLSAYQKPYSLPKGSFNASIDMTTPVRVQVNSMESIKFFKQLARLLKDNPPSLLDKPTVEKMEKLGIVPGKDVSPDSTVARSFQVAQKVALEEMMTVEHLNSKTVNGWHIPLKTGLYGTNYLQRALVAAVGLGANRPQDAVYPYATLDSTGAGLSGKNRYVVHFAKDKMPPVKGFWSITMYNRQFFFVENPLKRYAISPRNPLAYNMDGSLDLYIQHDSPGKDRESNWLPAPQGNFILMLRLYWPDDSVLDGSWTPPP